MTTEQMKKEWEEVKDNFLKYNETISNINLPNPNERETERMKKEWEELKGTFLKYNETVSDMYLPKRSDIFLQDNESISNLNLPKVKRIGDNFLADNLKIDISILPSLIKGYNKIIEHELTLDRADKGQRLQEILATAEELYSNVSAQYQDSENNNGILPDEVISLEENIEKIKQELLRYGINTQGKSR